MKGYNSTSKIDMMLLSLIVLLCAILIGMSQGVRVFPFSKLEGPAQDPPVIAETRVDPVAAKLTSFYMHQNRKIWEDLAAYQADATVQAADKHGVPLSLLVGVVNTESQGYPFAISNKGAKGPAQIMFKAHGDRFTAVQAERDKFDPMINIDCAAELLSEYVAEYGVDGALQVYNLGETAYRHGKRSKKYVAEVRRAAEHYRLYAIN